jgi:hypothetical protein
LLLALTENFCHLELVLSFLFGGEISDIYGLEANELERGGGRKVGEDKE